MNEDRCPTTSNSFLGSNCTWIFIIIAIFIIIICFCGDKSNSKNFGFEDTIF